MMWYDKIYKLAKLEINYGEEYSPSDRYEYYILTFDKDKNIDYIPGAFSIKTEINQRIRELSEIVEEKTKRKCPIGRIMRFSAFSDELPSIFKKNDKKFTSDEKKIRRRKMQQLMSKREERRESACYHSAPGGSWDHSER